MFALQRQVFVLVSIGTVVATLLFGLYTSSFHDTANKALTFVKGSILSTSQTRQLHLLVPATAPTQDFCKFLLSSTITGYPEPILVGWEGHGEYNGAKSHLFKVSEGLSYLKSLPSSADDDLAFMLDAYDIWMLLRPEVIISRYYEVIKRENERLRGDGLLGKSAGGLNIETTIIFGADKTCFPPGAGRLGCWVVPNSPMRKHAFGPDTDKWMVPARPRWLNSGTILGPVKDMRDMFDATMAMIHSTFNESYTYRNSDQQYFQDVWAEQEVTRLRLRDGVLRAPVLSHDQSGKEVLGDVPDILPGKRTEFHIGMDYDVDIFQQNAGFAEYVTWMSFNHSTSSDTTHDFARRPRLDELQLPADIQISKPPFPIGPDLPAGKSWKDVRLGVDVAGQKIFPLFHMTGDKGYRQRWWHYVWFHPHAKALLAANMKVSEGKDSGVIATVHGIRWTGASMSLNGWKPSVRGGAWSDQGARLDWDDMCGHWENALFNP